MARARRLAPYFDARMVRRSKRLNELKAAWFDTLRRALFLKKMASEDKYLRNKETLDTWLATLKAATKGSMGIDAFPRTATIALFTLFVSLLTGEGTMAKQRASCVKLITAYAEVARLQDATELKTVFYGTTRTKLRKKRPMLPTVTHPH